MFFDFCGTKIACRRIDQVAAKPARFNNGCNSRFIGSIWEFQSGFGFRFVFFVAFETIGAQARFFLSLVLF